MYIKELEENINPLRRGGGQLIFYHELDGEFFFFRLEIYEREGDILLVWVLKRIPKRTMKDLRGYSEEKRVNVLRLKGKDPFVLSVVITRRVRM